jgi:hypothetical protein
MQSRKLRTQFNAERIRKVRNSFKIVIWKSKVKEKLRIVAVDGKIIKNEGMRNVLWECGLDSIGLA